MTDRAAITAEFEDVKRVKTRKVWQLIFEVPEERYDDAMEALGGSPRSGQSRPVAIALLKPGTKPAKQSTPDEQPHVEHRSWSELTPTQQAGIACNDPAFQRWICLKNGNEPSEDTAARMVRGICGVESRSELSIYPAAATAWGRLYVEFKQAEHGDTEAARLAQRDRT